MKRQKGGLSISQRVTRSTTRLDRNSLTLPVEVITEIFLRLPLNSIATCRCVCKLWSSVLRSQDFTDSFLTKSCARPQLLFACSDYRHEIHFLSSPQPENPEDNSHVVAANHLACFPTSYGLFGCTNGFFCYGANQGKNKAGIVTVICNPSTGQSLTLPRLNSKDKYRVESYLGYDPVAKEFKVLSVCDDGKEHHVLTLGTKKLSWRVVECCIPHSSSSKWISISGVLYYIAAEPRSSSRESMVVCFDLRSEKFSSVKLLGGFTKALPLSATMINYNGRLALLMSSEDTCYVFRTCKRFKLWVLRDAAKHEWSKRVYVLPPSWNDLVTGPMYIAGMVGTKEIVFSPHCQIVPSYVIYFNVKSKTIRKVGIQGMEAFQGEMINTYLNYVENVELL
ncbi:putative F-box protein At2g19630 isoform X2 [Brassica rapa]|nr:putative F-box protein At2g19630 isoform X2 [Brassica rapa]XP_033145752.1 putative F-box protein At2g19630 isoform X2 [Brassica rapa]XP_033145753.1 putative F-box protein At2g19630 isoform X2 [Brassica rapa]